MVPQNRIRRNSLQARYGYIVRIYIADKGKGGVFGQSLLKGRIGLSSYLRVIRLPGLNQILIDLSVGIAAVIGTLAASEHLIGMIIGIKRTPPANEIGHLLFPIYPGRDFHGYVNPYFL